MKTRGVEFVDAVKELVATMAKVGESDTSD